MKAIELKIPGDKSISHRAVIFGSLAEGKSIFHNFLASDDCLHTIQCFRDMGVNIKQEGTVVEIEGVGLHGLKKPAETLYVGNSGTSIRLLTGILAGQRFDSEITGDSSIQKRPMRRILNPLRQMGAIVQGDEKGDEEYPPLKIIGGQKLHGINYTMTVASAQVDSCIRLAGMYADSPVEIDKQGMQYRDHTERIMYKWLDYINKRILLSGEQTIPSDISSAAFFLVAGLILPDTIIKLPGINTNPTRTGILLVLQEMGAKISGTDNDNYLEETADIVVQSSKLHGVCVKPYDIPTLIDEIPIIALAAALAEGDTVISGAEELRHKESDRLKTISTELNRIGANIEEKPDGLIIHGLGQGGRLKGAACKSYGDHRIAMMLKIANLVSVGEITIDDTECIKTSFPNFEELLAQIGK
ncbi:MAG: 3-phosphoshikimate 1-carboxyvinyltransferase [Candidatus Margulisiibacteriota bacterium]